VRQDFSARAAARGSAMRRPTATFVA